MSYQYDKNNGFENTPKKSDNDIGSWVFIGLMFLVAWPVGLFFLIAKLTDDPKKKKTTQNYGKASGTYTSTTGAQTAQKAAPKTETKAAPKAKAAPKKSAVKKVTSTPQYGRKGSRAMTIVGIVLAALGALACLGVLSDFSFYFGEYGDLMWFLEDIFPCLGLLSGGIALLFGGGMMKRRARRFAKYVACAGDRKAIPLAELARAADVRLGKAERDIEMMVEKGMWGKQAYVDNGQDMLFLSAAAAQEYYESRNVRAKPVAEPKVTAAPTSGFDHDFRISAIRRANDRIDDAELSAKIDRLEQVTGRIFKFIEDNPKSADKANTFLKYYLPTTQKLLDSYADFEEAGISGENLNQAKERIEQTMDNIIAGFEHQLDELYRETAMDIDSDIRVMETMLRRDTASVADDFGLGGAAVQTMPKE